MRYQTTIKRDVTFEGIGLHTGIYCRVNVYPAPVDHGIVFHRPCKNASFFANVGTVTDTVFATTIGNERAKISTVEHILAVLSALSIDNVTIEVEGPEIPILDGSAIELVNLLMDAGIKKQKRKMPYIRVLKPVVFEDKNTSVTVYPYNGRKISFRLFFPNHFLGEQFFSVDINEDTFIRDIAPARTFGFLKDEEYFRQHGLAKGVSLQNAVIFSDSDVINETGLRFTNECVRHKILDSIGDFALSGFPIMGHIVADKSGHTSNIKFLNTLLSSTDCWEVVTGQVEKSAYPVFSLSYT
ncbi:UDP-3-O-acyl-N-acetylglucosamine deacetylase [Candidatus Magnetomonas plexicatena]|uniref:UDP-3-O-acyl-N-acetylglucosamine deacetylase n=1 Tax=Candidatus Magnetomonas plexicatena TaxID=2552947 RepID=UPI0011023B4F|nr:UDP-3-O-acyl-N-acetylglucosamine deacetylase [Nitrospirales bacterium LBB_01]